MQAANIALIGTLSVVGAIYEFAGAYNTIKNSSNILEENSKLNSCAENNISEKLPKTSFTTKKLQHEYKHSSDFDVQGNWNSTKATEYQQAIQNHINSAPEIYRSTYRGDDVYVYLNRETGLGAYVDMHGDYIGGWKFSENQIQFHLNNGKKIK